VLDELGTRISPRVTHRREVMEVPWRKTWPDLNRNKFSLIFSQASPRACRLGHKDYGFCPEQRPAVINGK